MYNYTLSFIAGLIAMLCACSSYFVKKKAIFLILQGAAIIFLAISCLFNVQYYACVSYAIALTRVLIYFSFEKKGKAPNMWLRSVFALATIVAYLITNVIILKDAKPFDLMLVAANCVYAFVFGIRDLRLLRLLFLAPTALCIVYFVLCHATPFVIISYAFEFVANVVAVFLYQKRKKVIKI